MTQNMIYTGESSVGTWMCILLGEVFLKCQSDPIDWGDVQFFFILFYWVAGRWLAPCLTLLKSWGGRYVLFWLVFGWNRIGIIKKFLFLLGHPSPDHLAKKLFWSFFSLLLAVLGSRLSSILSGTHERQKEDLGNPIPSHCPCPEVHRQSSFFFQPSESFCFWIMTRFFSRKRED